MPKGSTLFELVNGLRYFGAGTKVTRSIYKLPETYWIITRVKLSKDQKHGSVYGRLIWRGLTKEKDEKIGAPLKKEWSLLQLPDYKKFNAKPDDFIPLFPPREIRLVEIAEENAKQQVEANNTQ